MQRYFWSLALLVVVLLATGCGESTPDQPPAGAVVQGSTAAPTEPPATDTPVPVAVAGAPAQEPTSTPSAAATVLSSATKMPAPPATDTPSPPATKTPAPPVTATVAPTIAPTAPPTPSPTASPTPAPTGTPYPTGVFVASHRGFSDGSSYIVVGEVLNTAGVPVFGVKVIGNFYDSGGNLVGAQQAQTSLAMTEPEVATPFKLRVENLASAVARYELTVTWEDVSLIEFRPLAVVDAEVRQGEVVGQIRNDQESTLTSIVVAVTFYDAAGGVVDTADIFLGGQTLAPNAAMSFAIPLSGNEHGYDHFWIEAQGNLNLF